VALNTTFGRRLRQKPPLGSQPDFAHPLARGLAGAWLLNESSGTRIFDSGPRHYTGVMTAPILGGRGGQARVLSDVAHGGQITNPTDGSLATFPAISMGGWVTPTVAANGNILNKDNNSGYRYRVNSGLTVTFFDRGGVNSVTTTAVVVLGTPIHIFCTGDASGLKIYFDGRLSVSGAGAWGAPGDSGGNLQLGDGAFGEWFRGAIENQYLYRRSLAPAEVAELYNDPYIFYPVNNYRRWFFFDDPAAMFASGSWTFGGAGVLPVNPPDVFALGGLGFGGIGLLTTGISLAASGAPALTGTGHLTSVGTARIRSGLCGHPTMALADWKLVGAC